MSSVISNIAVFFCIVCRSSPIAVHNRVFLDILLLFLNNLEIVKSSTIFIVRQERVIVNGDRRS